jgi:AraC-like DNA-binding protein
MSEPTVSAGFVRALADFAVARGADRTALLAAAAIDPSRLEDQDSRLPFARYVALMAAAKTLTGDPALALHYGEAIEVAQFSIVGLIGEAAATMTDAFQQLNRYVRLIVEVEGVSEGDRFQVRFERGGAWVVDTRLDPNAFPELTESAFAHLVCGTRKFGTTPLVMAVEVTHPDPGYPGEYERILGAPITFDAAWNAMRVDPEWATHQVARLPRYAFAVLSQRGDALLAELEASKSMRGRVERLILPMLHTGQASADAVAARLGVSRQTLWRRLRAEGAAFESVLDALRHRLAVDYLTARKVSVNETAYLVGFSEPAAFSRAFKRWTGVSPRAFAARERSRGAG